MSLPIVKMGLNRPLPIEVTQVTQTFWEGLAQGNFLIIACNSCGRMSFPPRRLCPKCHQRDFTWKPVSGNATLYSVTKVHSSPSIYGILSPFHVAVIDLEEGIRIVTRLLPSGKTPELDSAVQLVITSHPDGYHYAAVAPHK